MQDAPHYDDVVREVGDFLVDRARRRARRRHRTPASLVRRPRHRLRQDRARTTSSCSARLDELVARVDVPVLVGTVAQVVHRRARRVGDGPLADARRRHARHRGVGASTTARASCGCTTPARRARCAAAARRDATRSTREAVRVKGRWAQGLEPRALLLDHQGPARGVRAPRRVRPQPPQGAPPGGADLAHRPRLHAHPLAARLAAQPARVRRGRHRVRAHAARPPRRVARHACPSSTRTLAAWLGDPQRAGARSTTRSSATACSACSPATSSTPASSPRVRTRSSSIEKITGRQLGSVGARDRGGHRRRGIVDSGRYRVASPELTMGTHRDQGPARARRARRAARGADPPAAVRGRRRAHRRPHRGGRDRRARRHRRLLRGREAVSRVVRSERYYLLERLATRIAEVCRVDERVTGVAVTVRKLHPPVRAMVDHVAVSHRAVSSRRPDASRVPRDRIEPRRPARVPAARGRRARRGRRRRGRRGVAGVRDRAGRRPRAARLPERGRRGRHRRSTPRELLALAHAHRGRRPSGSAPSAGGRARSTSTCCSSATSRSTSPTSWCPHPRMARAGVRARAPRRPRPGVARRGSRPTPRRSGRPV